MLYAKSGEFIHIVIESLYPLTNTSFPDSWQAPFCSLCLYELDFLDSTYEWDGAVFVFLCLHAFFYWSPLVYLKLQPNF